MSLYTASYYAASVVAWCMLVVLIAFTYFRIDDLTFDVYFWVTYLLRWLKMRRYVPFTAKRLSERPQQRIAIFVACWHEAEVIDRMVDFAMHSIDYENFDLMIGVYPNDAPTLEKAQALDRQFARVHCVVNDLPGPTTKAQNLNCVYRAMRAVEGDDPFKIVVLHDTEDVVHPMSLKLYNHLLPERQMVQIPVFPLERSWTEFVAWTYADEFAKNHQKDMLLRERLGAFVPSAGVGTAVARDALEVVAESSTDLFPEGALTEDYQFALRLHERGLKTIFVAVRLSPQGKGSAATAAAYVATREYFPDTFRAAVRQKSRWVAGIALQSWREIGWRGGPATLYTLYRDRKSVVANLAAFFGYIVLVAGALLMLAHWWNPAYFAPRLSNDRIIWVMLEFVLLGTLIELVQTACFVAWIYGPAQGLLSIARAPVAAIVNGVATVKAIQTFTVSLVTGKPLRWAKTTHAFPTEKALAEFRAKATYTNEGE
ncbi:MAG: phage adsorption protein NrfB [Candidatus Eremiobacteraeota bacterium]|nr:phage adsorption protein NrfB [Candidatus Eremiobacteraeota bacterium]